TTGRRNARCSARRARPSRGAPAALASAAALPARFGRDGGGLGPEVRHLSATLGSRRLVGGLDLLGVLGDLAHEPVAVTDHVVRAVPRRAPAVFLGVIAPLVAGEPAQHAGVTRHLPAQLAMARDQLRHDPDALLGLEQALLYGAT